MSPARHVSKVYEAVVEGVLARDAAEQFQKGLVLRDGTVCLPARLEILAEGAQTQVRVTLREGKYHQVKRMVAAAGGRSASGLRRVQLGGLRLDPALPAGAFRELTGDELALLRQPGADLG